MKRKRNYITTTKLRKIKADGRLNLAELSRRMTVSHTTVRTYIYQNLRSDFAEKYSDRAEIEIRELIRFLQQEILEETPTVEVKKRRGRPRKTEAEE